jgi:hypothetical protein
MDEPVKTCNACKAAKPLDEFHKSAKSPDGRQYRCKECSNAASRQYSKDNPEAKRKAMQKYGQTDKYKGTRKARREGPRRERILEQKRESWYRDHESNLGKLRARQLDPEFRRKQRERYERWRKNDPRGLQRLQMKNLYGLDLAQWDRMVIRQLGRCAVCEQPCRDLHVDHDHETGKIRALLCHKCNRGIGLFNDDPERLRAAARYVTKHRRRTRSDIIVTPGRAEVTLF